MEVIYSALKGKQINDYLFIDTCNSNKITIGMNEMMENDSLVNTGCISPAIA